MVIVSIIFVFKVLRATYFMPRPKGGSGNVSPRQPSSNSVNTHHRVGSSSSSNASKPQSQPKSSRYSQPSYRDEPRVSNYNQGPSPLTGFFLASMLSNMTRRSSRPTTYNQPPQNQYPPQYPQQPGYNQRKNTGAATVIWIVFLMFLMLIFLAMCGGCSSGPTNDYNREKLKNNIPYNADCIVDDLGFFVNPDQTGQRLKTFYDQTGVQPYIVITEATPSLQTTAQMENYMESYYKQNIDNQNTFLYMYFGDPYFSETDEVGDMFVYRGENIKSVMDAAAVDIFWDYIDQEWRSDLETDDLFVKVYDETAKRIMTKSTTSKDIMMRILLIVGIIAVGLLALYYVKLKHKREREKAEETKAILETPLATDDPNDDDLLKRYGG